MMFVLINIDYGDVCGVYTSREKAEKAIKTFKIEDDSENEFTDEEWREFFSIEEHIMDSVYNISIQL